MAKNDNLLIDGIIDDRVAQKNPSNDRGEAFELLCIEQVLKDWDLTRDDIVDGWIDGRGDGGIDGFYIIINGHPLIDVEQFTWPKSNSELIVHLISCKSHDTFKQATVDALIATLPELFDSKLSESELEGEYSRELLVKRQKLLFAYRKLAPRLGKMRIEVTYGSRGDTAQIGIEVNSRASQVEKILRESFVGAESHFEFIGSAELVDLVRRKPNYSLDLPFIANLSRGETYAILVRLKDYFHFCRDENGKLRRYLFDSNVRDFMGLNRVNDDIRSTLEATTSPDFWWLNNGITILATKASVVGNSINMEDIQIVNGLQTTESIFRHFDAAGSASLNDDRAVLVKVIVSQEDSVRDSIIRATNNQTSVEQISLHATDRIQRDIEDVLHRHGILYERRKNFYVNQGHSVNDIVTPLYIAAGYASLALKVPHIAASFRSKFIREAEAYDKVFNPLTNLDVWPVIAQLLRRADAVLESVRPAGGGSAERFLKSNRHILCFSAVSLHLKNFDFTVADLIKMDVDACSAQLMLNVWSDMQQVGTSRTVWTRKRNVVAFLQDISQRYNIANVLRIEKAEDPFYVQPPSDAAQRTTRVTMEFAKKVLELLPHQPWKPGMHSEIVSALGCTKSEYFSAVDLLVEDGQVHRQKDGVVYDADGGVISFDPERVDPTTMQLL